MLPTRSALVVARRALVVAVMALVAAAVALAAALWGGSESDPAESAVPAQTQTDAAAARAEAEGAADLAEAAVAIAQEAAANAAAAEEALAAARAGGAGDVDPEVIARLEAQLEQLQADAAAARAEADARVEEAPAADTTPEDAAAPEEAPEQEDAAAPEEAAEQEDAAAPEEAAEQEDTDAAVPLPGEPFELGPPAGTGLAVVGISSDSALNVRDVPNGQIIARLDNVMDGVRDDAVYVRGADSDEIIATVDLQHGVVATGNTRRLPTTIWNELSVDELTGWASAAFLGQIGATDDATAEVVATLGELPVADTMLELGLAVAQTMVSQEPRSRVVVSEAPGIFEALAQMTVDVVDIGDDSVLGFRLVIFAHPAEEDWMQDDPGPFTLKSVERTVLCHSHRGVSEEGLCN